MRRIAQSLIASVAGVLGLMPLCAPCEAAAAPAGKPALDLESTIPLGNVHGRLDHLAYDPARRRLFVAELGNDSLGVVDLRKGRVIRTIGGLSEPQGVGYVPSADTVYVADGGDGSVRLFQGDKLAPAGVVDLKDDADNVRIDAAANSVLVGYGAGALAVIGADARARKSDIRLHAHPEGFQVDSGINRIFVNVPDAGEIAVVDRASGKQEAAWKVPDARGNFPMAVGDQGKEIAVAFRRPAKFIVLDATSGRPITDTETCGDADDIFFAAKRHRFYVSCGEGFLDVFAAQGGSYARTGRIETRGGARTSLFVPELDRLYVAVPASWTGPPAIWVYRPAD